MKWLEHWNMVIWVEVIPQACGNLKYEAHAGGGSWEFVWSLDWAEVVGEINKQDSVLVS